MRTLVTIIALGCLVTAQAQNRPPEFNKAVVNDKKDLTGFEILPIHPPSNHNNSGSRAIDEEPIGETYYDLQSNGSVQNRAIRHTDGTNSAVFTFSSETSSSFTDRGTNYNYYDGSAWDPISYNRIENERTGWPSLMYTGGGKEITVAHTSNSTLLMSSRNTKGSGTFSFSTVSSGISNGYLWPRATTGGPSNNTIHLIAITEPVANGGTRYQGLDGAIAYFRSTDQGATWNIQDSLIPGTADSLIWNGYRGDGYTIVARGNTVAIVSFSEWGDSWMAKSTDNGDTWSVTTFWDFPIDDFQADQGSDFDNDGDFDTIQTTDGSGAAIIDQNGIVHIFYGNMRVLDADTTDGNTSYFPGTSGLMYWNDAVGGLPKMIADVEDVNNNGTLEFDGFALYYMSLTGMPSVGINTDGTLFVTYSGYKESHSTGTQQYRHIYCMKSNDAGTNWTTPVDVTPDNNFEGLESVFPTMCENVDDKVRFWIQRDIEPGLAVRGDMDPIGLNEILFFEVDTILSPDVSVLEQNGDLASAQVYPNPVKENLTLEFSIKNSVKATIYITDVTGKRVKEVFRGELTSGDHLQRISLGGLEDGIYNMVIQTNEERLNKQFVLTR